MMKRCIRAVNNEAGSSLMYVLAAMLLLLIIGVSILTAASANVGFNTRQRNHARGILLADSVQRNILYGLQQNKEAEESLANQLLYTLFAASEDFGQVSEILLEMYLSGELELAEGIYVESIMLSFPEQQVQIQESIPAILMEPQPGATEVEMMEDIPREPKTATVDAHMMVTVRINIKGNQMISRAYYEYSGGMLSDDPEGKFVNYIEGEPDGPGEMVITEVGEWRMIRHEKVEL